MQRVLPLLKLFVLSQRMIVFWVLLCAFHTVWALDPEKQLGQYRRQSWQIDSGLPQNTVHAVLQTRDGFLWMATEGGLVRFDGFDFRIFDTSNTPQLHSNFVEDLMEDRTGALWISTSDGLLRLRGGELKTFSIAEGLPSNTVTKVYQQSAGRIIAVTAAGLASADGDRFGEIGGTGIFSNAESVSILSEDSHGTLWAGGGQQLISVKAGAMVVSPPLTAHVGSVQVISAGADGEVWVGGSSGLECLRDGQPCTKTEDGKRQIFSSLNVTALLHVKQVGGADRMWVGTTTGLVLFSQGGMTKIDEGKGTAEINIKSFFQDRYGALWVVSGHGLARVFHGQLQRAPAQIDISGVLSVFEDSEGSMWFGTESGGVSVLRDQPFSSITTQQGLSADFVRTVFQDHAGTIWIGTNNGGLDKFADGKISASRRGLSSNVVLALAETGHDLWVGTPDGLTRIRDGHALLFTAADGLADNFVRSLFADTDGTLWIGTNNGLSHLREGVFRSYSTAQGLGSDVIGGILRTNKGELLVGTLAGLSRLQGDRFLNATKSKELGGDAVTALFEGGDGTIWIGTNGSGLARLRDRRVTRFSVEKTGLPDTVYGILEDTTGNLWMSSKRGVYRVATAALNAYAGNGSINVPVVSYGAADGMQISECSSGGHPSAWRMQDGTMWFATLKGVAWVNPQAHSKRIQPPQVAIEQVLLDSRVVEPGGLSIEDWQKTSEIIVPPGGERITIHYAGLSFLAPQKVHYRYMLQGFDRGWVQAGSARTAYYTNVPPGRYKFSVMASNAEGVWSLQPTSLKFRVQPRFFQTIWFYLLMGATVFGLGYLLYRVRVHYVEAKYQAVMAERGRIAREVHDTLAQGYVGISVQLEITSRLLENSQSAALDQLNQTKELVRSGLAEARSSIWELRSQGEDTDILPSRVAAATKIREHREGAPITLQVHGTYRPLPREIEDQILRVVQEAINNAQLHSKASQIGVTLTYDAKSLSLCVLDDGVGLSQSWDSFATSGHFGLKGMQERAATIGAALHVDSRPGEGCEVTLIVNMPHKTGEGMSR
jgi:ligand-binding sensor domain-containing protein/signal transduction histidine kinase